MQTSALQKKEHKKSVEPALSHKVESRVVSKEEHGTESGVPLFLQRIAVSSPSTPFPVQRQAFEDQEEYIINQSGARRVQRQPDNEKNEDNEELSVFPKLIIGAPNDKYEQEADHVAEQVMRIRKPVVQHHGENEREGDLVQTTPLSEQITPLVQRQDDEAIDEEDKTLAQAKLSDSNQSILQKQKDPKEEKKDVSVLRKLETSEQFNIQRQEIPEEDEEERPIQPKLKSLEHFFLQRQGIPEEDDEENSIARSKPLSNTPIPSKPTLEDQIQSFKGGGQPLSKSDSAFFEPRFGKDFSHVRLHTDERATEAARKINAKAFTVGENIVFGKEHYTSGSKESRNLLAHELTHVVQQNVSGKNSLQRASTDILGMGDVPPSEFISSNDEFFKDLIMAINEYGKNEKGKMDGQVPFYTQSRHEFIGSRNWTAIEKKPLKRELLAWHQNAADIAVSNYEILLFSFIDVISEKIFKEAPGLSAWEQDLITIVENIVEAILSAVIPGGPLVGILAGSLFDIFVDVTVNHINEAMIKKELEERRTKFIQLIRGEKVFRNAILSEIYNLTTLLSYYQSWLDLTDPKELYKYRIPFSPDKLNEGAVKEKMFKAFMATAESKTKSMKKSKISRIGLFYFLDQYGIIISNDSIDIALTGEAGAWAHIRQLDKFPVWRFINPYITYERRPKKGDRVHVYILPKANKIFGLEAPENTRLIALLSERTASYAIFNYISGKWITGITHKEWSGKLF